MQRLTFEEKALRKVFLGYYKCKSISTEKQKDYSSYKTQIGIVAGLTQTRTNVSAEETTNKHLNGKSVKSMLPSFGIQLTATAPRNRGRLAFHTDLLFQQYEVTSTNEVRNSAYRTVYVNTYNFSDLTLNVGGRYYFANSTIRPFGDIGATGVFSVKREAYTTDNKIRLNEAQPYESYHEDIATRPYQIGIWLGAGVTYEKFALEARLSSTNGWSDVPAIAVSVNRASLLFSYRIF